MINLLFIDNYINVFIQFLTFDDLLNLRLTCKEIKDILYDKAEFTKDQSIEIHYSYQGLNLMKLFRQIKYYFEFTFIDSLTDEDIFYLTNLTELDLSNNSTITDKGVINLSEVTTLYVGPQSKITDESLKSMPKIDYVCITGNYKLTNDGLESLPNLISIDLEDGSNITDKGIKKLVNLEYLGLHKNMNSEQIQRLFDH